MHIIIVLAIVFVVNQFVYKKKSSSVKTNSLNNLKVISSFSKARTLHIPSYLIDCNDSLGIYYFHIGNIVKCIIILYNFVYERYCFTLVLKRLDV